MKYKNVVGDDGKLHLRESDASPRCLCGYVITGSMHMLAKKLSPLCNACKRLSEENDV